MNRTSVDSSMIAAIGYDETARILEIEFNGKAHAVWQYKAVPPEVYTGLINAHSIGKYFLANIKGIYAEEKQ